ncbi:MAG: 50S ribosomal protein L15 [Dehalococcoidia bacterium]|jgi:large subunit ribosomal protein L15|nr:50S ribosomal protein L15 [Chloroflexota bacterium]RZP13093.1 MAG: 50S ribosomal protein L15 [Chloroflexota bacterium]|tara:strand:- start:10858 stop:11301 length:444 start_codon:yes stop_codon:yes gene_type:complete
MPQLHDIKRKNKNTPKSNQVGRGNASKGTYSGRGIKGQLSRSGGNLNPTFEGGQLRLVKKLPHMRGFTNVFKKDYVALNISDLINIFTQDSVTIEDFKKKGVIKNKQMIKVLGNGEISKSLNLEVHAISSSAKSKIEKAGGEVKVIN